MRILVATAALAALMFIPSAIAAKPSSPVVTFVTTYKSNTGAIRQVYVTLPFDYHGEKLPIVISPHGRGTNSISNTRLWGFLPQSGFIVVSPMGQGRKLSRFSWGWRGQIDDLAKMPAMVAKKLPWLHYDKRRIYAIGGSMGGQEVLMLDALYPKLLAGVAAFDPATDLLGRYRDYPPIRPYMRKEIGDPVRDAVAYKRRSPLYYAGRLARSRAPIQIWYSDCDQIVTHQESEQSGLLIAAITAINPKARLTVFEGNWTHIVEMQTFLPYALGQFELAPNPGDPTPLLNLYTGC